jgi:flagellar biogenesis protein FliO
MVVILALGVVSTLTVARSEAAPLDKPDASADSPAWLSQRGKAQTTQLGAQSEGPSTWRSLLLLVLVGGLGGGALYMKKRRGLPRASAAAPPSTIRVLASTRLSPKAHAIIAQVGGRTILLGVTDSNVRRLAWLDEGAAAPALTESDPIRAARTQQASEASVALNFEGRPVQQLATGITAPAVRGTLASSRFSEVLEARLKGESEQSSGLRRPVPSAADTLAEMTEDVFRPSRGARSRKTARSKASASASASSAEPSAPSAPSDSRPGAYEGQIAGLSARIRGNAS